MVGELSDDVSLSTPVQTTRSFCRGSRLLLPWPGGGQRDVSVRHEVLARQNYQTFKERSQNREEKSVVITFTLLEENKAKHSQS